MISVYLGDLHSSNQTNSLWVPPNHCFSLTYLISWIKNFKKFVSKSKTSKNFYSILNSITVCQALDTWQSFRILHCIFDSEVNTKLKLQMLWNLTKLARLSESLRHGKSRKFLYVMNIVFKFRANYESSQYKNSKKKQNRVRKPKGKKYKNKI